SVSHRRKADGRVIVGSVAGERETANGCIFLACADSERVASDSRIVTTSCVFSERIRTDGRVKTTSGVVPHGCGSYSGEVVAGGIHEGNAKTNGQIKVGVVDVERLRPNSHVKIPCGIAFKRSRTNRDVIKTVRIVMKRIETHSRIVDSNSSINVRQS